MSPAPVALSDKSRLAVLLEHFATIDDPRDVPWISHPLAEILLLVVCGTIAACGEAHPDFLRRHSPYKNGVPGGRWLTILMNRINPALFSAVFQAPHRCCRHLSERSRHHPPGRRHPAGAVRRMGHTARPLHNPGNHRHTE